MYDKNAKDLKPLKDYSNVRVQKGTWKPCVVTGATETLRSYKIVTDDGRECVRNRRFLRSVPTTNKKKPVPESPSPKTQSIYHKMDYPRDKNDNGSKFDIALTIESSSSQVQTPLKRSSFGCVLKPKVIFHS